MSLSLVVVSKTISTNRGNYMKHKLIITAIVALAMSSCGYEISIQSTETSTTTSTTTIPPTTTTVYFGTDCYVETEIKWNELSDEVSKAWKASTDGNGVPTSSEWRNKIKALRNLRSFIRGLDIPTISTQQQAYVNAIEDYMIAFNQYIDSGKKDLSVNNYQTPLNDTEDDFVVAWNKVCMNRKKAGA